MAYTASTIHTEIRRILNETTAGFFLDADIDDWVNQASLDISGIMRCVEATELIGMETGVRHYPVASDAIEGVHAQEEAAPLRAQTPS